MTNHPSEPFEFNQEVEGFCDELVRRYFNEVKRKRRLPEYRSIQYFEKRTGDILLACVDGSLLYTPCDLGPRVNLLAFENGFRSDLTALERLRTARDWEYALS